ncbi:hypothetical protein M8J77_009123 [Diaphorina citri]|nr:hypothetical protein M8J77_009123 [Diaphorina citri]
MINGPSKTTAQKLMNLSRHNIRMIVGLLIGHCHLRKYLNTIGVYNGTTLCRNCGESEETASHVLIECPALGLKRLQILGHPGQEIGKIHSEPIKTLLNFIKETAIFEGEE